MSGIPEGSARLSKVTADISMSLDGFVTEPNPGGANPLGDDPGRLHDWMFSEKTATDAEIVDEIYAAAGAVLIGKRMFDVGMEPWGDPPPFGMPVFVLTHESRAPLPRRGGTTYHFVTGGLDAALADARAAAGEKDVGVWGGAHIVTQYLQAGLLDELQLHVIPILLGGGVRLFQDLNAAGIELRKTRSIDTPRATHLRFSVLT
jgi:dihydrofolate reductase